MAANIGEIRAGVSPRIKDEDGRLSLTPDLTCDVDRAILSALCQYEKARPRHITAKIAGAGTFDYAVALLTGGTPAGAFVDGFSSIEGLAYPYLTTDQVLNELEPEEFGLVRLDTGLKLRFFAASPASTEFFLVQFTVPHTVNAAASTVASSDDEALKDLGAAFACDMLAALYAKDVDSSISADAVDRRTKSDNYRSEAASYRKSYDAKMQTGAAAGPAVAMGDIDRAGFGHRGWQDHFFHGWRTH